MAASLAAGWSLARDAQCHASRGVAADAAHAPRAVDPRDRVAARRAAARVEGGRAARRAAPAGAVPEAPPRSKRHRAIVGAALVVLVSAGVAAMVAPTILSRIDWPGDVRLPAPVAREDDVPRGPSRRRRAEPRRLPARPEADAAPVRRPPRPRRRPLPRPRPPHALSRGPRDLPSRRARSFARARQSPPQRARSAPRAEGSDRNSRRPRPVPPGTANLRGARAAASRGTRAWPSLHRHRGGTAKPPPAPAPSGAPAAEADGCDAPGRARPAHDVVRPRPPRHEPRADRGARRRECAGRVRSPSRLRSRRRPARR